MFQLQRIEIRHERLVADVDDGTLLTLIGVHLVTPPPSCKYPVQQAMG